MAQPVGGTGRVAVRIEASVWREEVERFAPRSPARIAAQRERNTLERIGIVTSMLLRCDASAADGTRLAGMMKAYVPLGDEPASTRPFGLVLAPAIDGDGDGDGHLYVELVAFGERHPRPGPEASTSRSVYERAHKRRHGRYPD